MSKLSGIIKSVQTSAKKHSPEILTGIGIAGMITTTIMAVRATPKAILLIESKKIEEGKNKLKPIETIKTAWTCYIPSAITGGLSIVCLIGASKVNIKRNAALATAYSLSESALKTYQEKVIETIGDKKEQAVRDEIAKDKITKDPITTKEIIITEKGNTLCYDTTSGRYFKSDIDKIKKIENEFNRRLRSEMYISLNEFYYDIGLDSTSIGENIGWNVDTGFELGFSSQLATDGTPCLVLDYKVAPTYDYK